MGKIFRIKSANFLSSNFHFPCILCGFIRQIIVFFHVIADLHHDGGNGVLVISNKSVPNGKIPRIIDPIVSITNDNYDSLKSKASENSYSFSISTICQCRVFSTSFSCRIFNNVKLKTIATLRYESRFHNHAMR